MGKTVIIYGSSTGNTETAAKWIKGAIGGADLMDVVSVAPSALTSYDVIILGSSTWGQGELQDDFAGFYDAMSEETFSGKKVAVFGCGDRDMFPDCFCNAVDLIADKAKECGAHVAEPLFRIDGDVDAYEADIKAWAAEL